MISSAIKPKKKVCKAVAQRMTTVVSINFGANRIEYTPTIMAMAKMIKLKGIKTLRGLKYRTVLIINWAKFKVSLIGLIFDLPALL